mmetsp:Transcript_122904/g.262251  ORF Transcript_122904/g.262251 Transcript_122904/m.262251 type:complete len:169 (-) Transcript_122904:29-535(-)
MVVARTASGVGRFGVVTLELGALVGYSTLRLARFGGPVRSIEVDALHVALARRVLEASRLGPGAAEVHTGQARDSACRLAEESGQGDLALAFLDHRGTVFHRDWERLRACRLPTAPPSLVADNVLKPGAPAFLWLLSSHLGTAAPVAVANWALTEFLNPRSEDWMAVS